MLRYRIKKEFPNSGPIGTYGEVEQYPFITFRYELPGIGKRFMSIHPHEADKFPEYIERVEEQQTQIAQIQNPTQAEWEAITKYKMPRPNVGDKYFAVNRQRVNQNVWREYPSDHMRYKQGNVFATEQEARNAAEVYRKLFL